MVEMVKSSTFGRFEGGTGGSDHRTEITDKSNRRTHIGNLTLLIVSLLETIPLHSKFSARIKILNYRSTDIVRTICTNLEKIFLAVSPTDNPEAKIHVGFISVSASRRMEKMARDVGGAELVDEPRRLVATAAAASLPPPPGRLALLAASSSFLPPPPPHRRRLLLAAAVSSSPPPPPPRRLVLLAVAASSLPPRPCRLVFPAAYRSHHRTSSSPPRLRAATASSSPPPPPRRSLLLAATSSSPPPRPPRRHLVLLATTASSLASSPPPRRHPNIPVFLNTFPCVGPCPSRAGYAVLRVSWPPTEHRLRLRPCKAARNPWVNRACYVIRFHG